MSVTVPSTGLKQVYDGSQSTKAEEMLTTVKKNKQFSFDKPLWAYNPYGTNSQSMYLYFKSDGKGYCRYTVSVGVVILRILHVHHLMAAQKILRRNMNIRSSVCFRDV